MADTTLNRIEQAVATDLLTTQLNALADNTVSPAGSVVNNVFATANFNGYPRCRMQLTLAAYSGTPSAGAAILFWFLKSIDGGTTYEDNALARAPDAIFAIEAIASGPQVPCTVDVELPAGFWKPIAKTSGVGLTLAASGNKITCLPYSFQSQ